MKSKNGKNNVVSFPLQKHIDDVSQSLQNDNCRDSPTEERSRRTALGWLGWGVARLAFFVLFWMRAPVLFLTGLAGKGCLIGFFICLLVRPNEVGILTILGSVSFGCFVFAWLYDSVVLALSPERVFLDSGRY